MEQKGFIALFSIVLGFIANSINIPMIILLILMLADYILGVLASIKTECKFDVGIALWGIIKKIGYGVAILFAILIDLLISEGISTIGWDIQYKPVFAIATTLYFCGLEALSGCRHLITLGVPVPEFLIKFSNFLKGKAENAIEITEEQGK